MNSPYPVFASCILLLLLLAGEAKPLAADQPHGATPLTPTPRAQTAADRIGPDGIVYPDFSRAGIPGGIPEVETVVKAADFGAIPNDDLDDAVAIQAAIAAAHERGGGAVLLDIGDYLIDQTLRIRHSGVVLRGADRERTRLVPRFAGKDVSDRNRASSVIDIQPEKINRRYDAWPDRPVKRGDWSVHLPDKDVRNVKVGDIVTFTALPPADIVATLAPALQKQARDGSYGSIYSWQYLQIVAVEGRTVTFDRPVRLDAALDQNPKLMHVPMLIEGCGVENLTIEQSLGSEGINGITLSSARGCWVRGVTVRRIGNWPLNVSRSWQFEIRDSAFDESRSRGGAAAYVGFGFACDGLVDGCRFTRLRHLSISMASNGLVFRNCVLDNIDINFHLNWPYEVLFENCQVDSGLGRNPAPGEASRGSYQYGLYTPRLDGDMHVPAGPGLTFYHNDFASPWDGVMLGGGATRNTIVAYNRFSVRAGFAAVVRRGSEGSVFLNNLFVLHDPLRRKGWMMKESYGSDDPESVRGAVFFPQGAPEGIVFAGNTFRVPRELPLFAGGQPDGDRDNTLTAALRDSGATGRVPLDGDWRIQATALRAAAATPDQRHPDPGPGELARQMLATDATDATDAAWPTVALPALLENEPVDFKRLDGEAVLRRRFDVPRELLGKTLTLSLGPIDDYDETWVNGRKVGATVGNDAWKTPRLYEIPADLLRPVGNVVAVRVWDAFGGGGFSGQRRDLWIGLPPRDVHLEEGQVPAPPVPSLYEWQTKQLRNEL